MLCTMCQLGTTKHWTCSCGELNCNHITPCPKCGMRRYQVEIAERLGSVHLVLLERDGPETHYHGLLIAPPKLDKKQAQQLMDKVFTATVKANILWSYDDVRAAAVARGFTEVQQEAEWWEPRS